MHTYVENDSNKFAYSTNYYSIAKCPIVPRSISHTMCVENLSWRELSLSHQSHRTYCFNPKIIEKFESVIPNGKRSHTLEVLISEFLKKEKLEK